MKRNRILIVLRYCILYCCDMSATANVLLLVSVAVKLMRVSRGEDGINIETTGGSNYIDTERGGGGGGNVGIDYLDFLFLLQFFLRLLLLTYAMYYSCYC